LPAFWTWTNGQVERSCAAIVKVSSVSRPVGNYQFHPQWSTLRDAPVMHEQVETLDRSRFGGYG
jgi:hypothetical protein